MRFFFLALLASTALCAADRPALTRRAFLAVPCLALLHTEPDPRRMGLVAFAARLKEYDPTANPDFGGYWDTVRKALASAPGETGTLTVPLAVTVRRAGTLHIPFQIHYSGWIWSQYQWVVIREKRVVAISAPETLSALF